MSVIDKIKIKDSTGAPVTVDIGASAENVKLNGESIDSLLVNFTGATGLNDGAKGLVPAPSAGDEDKCLKGDGTWGTVAGGVSSVNGKTGSVTLNAEDVEAVPSSSVGAANGVAELDAQGHLLASQFPGSIDEIIEGYYKAADGKFYEESTYITEITGEASKIYVSLDTNKTYRWSSSAFVEISASLALGETALSAFRGDHGKAAYDHSQDGNAISSAVVEGLYKIGGTAEGHISSLTAVTKADITGLGIPASDTTYTVTAGNVNSIVDWNAGSITNVVVNDDILEITLGAAPVLDFTPTAVVASVVRD